MDTQGTLGTHGRHEDIVGYVGGQVGYEGCLKDPGTRVHEGDWGTWEHRVAMRVLCPWGGAVLEMMQLLTFLTNFSQGFCSSSPGGREWKFLFKRLHTPGKA
ncbi:hypothetical protein Nmel_012427 [Mimus melanotis]